VTVRAGREYASAVRAALLHEIGGEPALGDAPEPAAGDGAVAELAAAALNPVDVTIATGVYYGGTPDLPYVVGREGVGRAVEGDRWPAGTLVYTIQSPSGTLAERFATGVLAWEVPDGDPAVIAALGIAGITGWMAVERRARLRPDERVLVLGATGTVGLVALHAARILGAGWIVAAGRDPDRLARAREAGAAAVVRLDEPDFEGALRAAFPDGGPQVVIDPLWGPPALAAMAVADHGARHVHLGQSAAPAVEITSAAVRGRELDILGFAVFQNPVEALAETHRRLVAETEAGNIPLELDRYPFDRVADAWRAHRGGGGRKVVVTG
jgi:NADPH:quinone reductase